MRNIMDLKNLIPALQSVLDLGKQTIMGFEEIKKKELFQSLKALISTKRPDEIVKISDVVIPLLDELLLIVQKNKKRFDSEQFAEDFYTARLTAEPFKFEG